MEGTTILALVLAIPVILIPAALIWHMNIGGMVQAVKAHKAQAVKATVGTK
jgi:hypothetical protein